MQHLSYPRRRTAPESTRALSPFEFFPAFFGSVFPTEKTPGRGAFPALDVRQTAEEIVVNAEIPGVDPEALEIEIHEDVLTLAGEKRAEAEREGERGTYTERSYGSFRRQVRLPAPVDAGAAEATHANGVVTVRIPKSAEVRPRRIEIKKA